MTCSCCTLKSGLHLCQGHAPSVLPHQRLVWWGPSPGGRGLLLYQHGSRTPTWLCQTFLWAAIGSQMPPQKLLFCSLPWGQFVATICWTLPAGSSSPSISIHTHTHLPVKSLDVQAFLGRAHHKVFYGKKELEEAETKLSG